LIKIGVVIPAHNEEKSLHKVISDIHEVLENYEYNIFVVDDGSNDDTMKIALRNNAQVAHHAYPLGVGGAIKTGFLMAKEWNSDIIVQIDADYQHDPHDIPKFLKALDKGEADLVIGSRFVENPPELNGVRKMGILFFTRLVNALTGYNLTDITNGYRVFRAELLDYLFFSAEKHWAIEMTLLAGKKGLRVREVPIDCVNRETGLSQFFNIATFFFYPIRALKQIYAAYSRGSS